MPEDMTEITIDEDFLDDQLEEDTRVVLDPITGLYTRQSFINQSKIILKHLMLSERPVCVIYLDIQGFKMVNQEKGFKVGDQLLKSFGELLTANFPNRFVSRFDNDHFVVFDFTDAIAERLDQVEEELRRICTGLKVDAGVYLYKSGDNFEEACDRAKLACEAVKSNEVQGSRGYFDDSMEESEMRKKHIKHSIQSAIDMRIIQVFYQPVIRSITTNTCSFEALARWNDKRIGYISPGEFIPVLEEYKLIHHLDLYIVENVLLAQRSRLDEGKSLVPVSVNLSQVDFEMMDMVIQINRLTDRYDIPRNMLIIEITESACISNPDLLSDVINRFHESGYQVWMDDFGSGYSSLNVLRKFNFDLIKFDLRFLEDFSYGSKGAIILKNMIQMARDLKIHTLAEGIENLEQFRFLKAQGCERLQGYFFSRPCSYDELVEKMESDTENYNSSDYYDAVGSMLEDNETMPQELRNVVIDLPEAILEVKDGQVNYIRSNNEYLGFLISSGIIDPANIKPQDMMKWKLPITKTMQEAVNASRATNGWICFTDRTLEHSHVGWIHVLAVDKNTDTVCFRIIMES